MLIHITYMVEHSRNVNATSHLVNSEFFQAGCAITKLECCVVILNPSTQSKSLHDINILQAQ